MDGPSISCSCLIVHEGHLDNPLEHIASFLVVPLNHEHAAEAEHRRDELLVHFKNVDLSKQGEA